MKSKPIQIIRNSDLMSSVVLYALCEDGSIWQMACNEPKKFEWIEVSTPWSGMQKEGEASAETAIQKWFDDGVNLGLLKRGEPPYHQQSLQKFLIAPSAEMISAGAEVLKSAFDATESSASGVSVRVYSAMRRAQILDVVASGSMK